MRRPQSIAQKMVGVAMLTTMVALLVSIAGLIAYDLRAFHRGMVSDLRTQAELLGHMTSVALSFDDARLARENLALLRLRPSVKAGAIYKADGGLFAAYTAPDQPRTVPPAPGTDGVNVNGSELLMFHPIIDKGELLGTVYLRAEYALGARLLDYMVIALAVCGLALLVGYLLMRRLGRVIAAPIVSVSAVAREVVATRDYSRRAASGGDDEAAELAGAFNAMLTEIEQRTLALESSNREIVREAEQRSRAQHEIMRLNAELEERVHERTVQLELANSELGLAMEQARSANHAKSAFLSSMSHELRTPLNAILGFAQILTSDTLPSTLVQKKEFASHILKSGRHLLTLINEILDLAKVESGTLNLSMEPVALFDVLAECRAMIEPLAATRRIRVLFPEHSPAVVLADRTRLKQILLNLLSNAVKYNRELGAVVLDCSASSPERVRLSVQDTGLGLKPDQVEALFQPFNRLGQEAGPEEGTGIGLVVTKRLVEMMGGAIGVSSSVGVGSLFWIELNHAAAQHTVVPESGTIIALPAQDQGRRTLLYVEDNPANLKLVQEIVRYRTDLRLLTAPDGHLGIELAKVHLPDIVLMDLNLPCVSGTDALIELKRDPRTAHIPVIALTANAMPRDIEKGLAAGFQRYLTKPINIEEFTAAIDATLAQIGAHNGAPRAQGL